MQSKATKCETKWLFLINQYGNRGIISVEHIKRFFEYQNKKVGDLVLGIFFKFISRYVKLIVSSAEERGNCNTLSYLEPKTLILKISSF